MFSAQSPQAKGLTVEFALANEYLKEYIRKYNDQFSLAHTSDFSAFVAVPDTIDLDRLLCVRWKRLLSSSPTISIFSKKFKIEQDKFSAKTKVTVFLSGKHGLKVLINGEFYAIAPLHTERNYNKLLLI